MSAKPSRFTGLLIALSVTFHGGLLLLPMPQWWLKAEEETTAKFEDNELEQSGAIALTKLPVVAAPDPKPEPPTPQEAPPTAPLVEAPPPLTQPDTFLEEDIPEDISEEVEESLEEPEEPEDPPLHPQKN